ncbi:hypothetical protein ACH5RR_012141 [Cinchona calisaya]|uniref:Uncharacterized protein n=1 Tax=Cinchona calisaya TaxID=153742 RepID=A0ABD3AAB7_9GENT
MKSRGKKHHQQQMEDKNSKDICQLRDYGYYHLTPGKKTEDGLIYILCEDDAKDLATYGLSSIENVDTNADYFDANKAKIAKITENAGAKSGANSENVGAENVENTGAENATNIDNTENVGAKNAENVGVENATNGKNACAENHATRQAENPDNVGSIADLKTYPSQDTIAEPNTGTITQEYLWEPTNVFGCSSRKNHGPKKKVSGNDKEQKMVDDVNIDDSSDADSFHDSVHEFEDETKEQTVEVDNMVDSNQTDGEGDAANFHELDSNESTCEDDGDITVQRRKHPWFKPKIDMDDPKFVLGLLFGTKEEFKRHAYIME